MLKGMGFPVLWKRKRRFFFFSNKKCWYFLDTVEYIDVQQMLLSDCAMSLAHLDLYCKRQSNYSTKVKLLSETYNEHCWLFGFGLFYVDDTKNILTELC